MFSQWFYNLSPETRGNLVLLVGTLLLLNSLELVYGLNFIIIVASVVMMWLGFVQAGYWHWVKTFIKKYSHHEKK